MTPKQFALYEIANKIKMNAQDLNFLPKTATLPI